MKTAFGDSSRLTIGLMAAVALAVLAVVLVASPADSSTSEPPHPVAGGSLDPATIPKFQEPLVIPPAMPRTGVLSGKGKQVDYYEIAVKQFEQYILPMGWSQTNAIGPTTVWSYGSMVDPRPVAEGGTLNYPALTIEANQNRPVRVKWINGLVDANGNYLPHLFAVDQTLHWANPAGGPGGTDSHGMDGMPYTGPVPIVTHVHGAHTTEDSDGYPEAWYLPAADNIPAGYATRRVLLRAVQAGGRGQTGSGVGARLGRVPVPERPAAGHAVVPRPLSRHDPAQRLRRPGRVLPAAQARRQGGRQTAEARSAAGGQARDQVPRDPDRHPGSLLQRRRIAVLSRQPRLLRGPERAGAVAAVPRRCPSSASRSPRTWRWTAR